MMRVITTHQINGLNEAIQIQARDEPGHGGANHDYLITPTLPSDQSIVPTCRIQFQKGPILEVGVNGISNEALLAIVQDRLAGFQSGPYACGDNQLALQHVQAAMSWLHKRTKERVERGVEGTHTV